MDWADYTQQCADLQAGIEALQPEMLVRLDVLGDHWGCSVTSDGPLPSGDWEVYREAPDPLGALRAVREAMTGAIGPAVN